MNCKVYVIVFNEISTDILGAAADLETAIATCKEHYEKRYNHGYTDGKYELSVHNLDEKRTNINVTYKYTNNLCALYKIRKLEVIPPKKKRPLSERIKYFMRGVLYITSGK